MENRLKLPSDEDFRKVETMISEFLKPYSIDLPHAIETVGQIISRPAKGTSSSKSASHSESTTKPTSPTSKGAL